MNACMYIHVLHAQYVCTLHAGMLSLIELPSRAFDCFVVSHLLQQN